MDQEIKEREEKYSELDSKFSRLHKRAKQRIQEVQKVSPASKFLVFGSTLSPHCSHFLINQYLYEYHCTMWTILLVSILHCLIDLHLFLLPVLTMEFIWRLLFSGKGWPRGSISWSEWSSRAGIITAINIAAGGWTDSSPGKWSIKSNGCWKTTIKKHLQ